MNFGHRTLGCSQPPRHASNCVCIRWTTMAKTLVYIVLLPLFFCAMSSKRDGTSETTTIRQNPGYNDSFTNNINADGVEGSDNGSIFAKNEGGLSKPKCGLRLSGYVSNLTTCVTIFCNFILVSRHWAFMPKRCAILNASGGVSKNLFTMGRLSHGEKGYSLVQTVRGEKIVAHSEIPAIMVKLEPSFIPNDCFQSWLPVSPPQSEFNNMAVEGYKGNEPKLYIVRKTKNVYPVSKQGCEGLFGKIYVHAIHFCILHKDEQGEQEFIPPGSPIYAHYRSSEGKEFHDIVGMKWRVIYYHAQYFAICFRLHNYVDWINSVING